MDVLAEVDFNLGAFLTDSQTGEILLGQGGEVCEVKDFCAGVPAFYLKDFYRNQYLCYRPARWFRLSQEKFSALLGSPSRPEVHETRNFDDLYTRDFESLSKAFDGDLRKVVLISREEYKTTDPEALRLHLLRQALAFGTGLPYGFWAHGYGVIGSTPEVLYSIQNDDLYTFALAGTSKLGLEKELLGSEKDRLEHDLVTVDIKEKLAPFCEQVENLPTQIANFKNIIHLKTEIKGKLRKGADLSGLTSSLSPTAALGGYPKASALSFLRSTEYAEAHPRRFFGSAMGVLNGDQRQFVVSIRNVQWEDDRFFIESGGGVLAQSKLASELEEIRLKRQTIRKHYL